MLYWCDVRDYELDKARTDELVSDFPSEGDVTLIISITGEAEVKFDSPNADSFDLTSYRKMRHRFSNLYLTNEAQAGKTLRLLFGRGDFDLSLAIETKRIGPGEETEMTGQEIVVLLENLTGNNRLSADAVRDGETNKVFTAAEKEKLATGVNLWNLLTGSLDNDSFIPFKDTVGVIKEILKVTNGNEVQLRSAGEDVTIEMPQEGKNLRVVKQYF